MSARSIRQKLSSGAEGDALYGRRLYRYLQRAGAVASIKRGMRRRLRRFLRRNLTRD